MNQEQIFSELSHSLQVELARFVFWDLLTRVSLFKGCSELFLTDICVLLREVQLGPEEIVHNPGEVCKDMLLVTRGVIEEGDFDESNMEVDAQEVVFRHEKAGAVGAFEFLFGLKHTLSARTSRSGAMCMRLLREPFLEVLKVHIPPATWAGLGFRQKGQGHAYFYIIKRRVAERVNGVRIGVSFKQNVYQRMMTVRRRHLSSG